MIHSYAVLHYKGSELAIPRESSTEYFFISSILEVERNMRRTVNLPHAFEFDSGSLSQTEMILRSKRIADIKLA
jgi:hypothetical protein